MSFPGAAAIRAGTLPSTVRVFCLPPAGGGASIFRRWGPAPPGLEIVPVQLPGREERLAEPPVGDASALVTEIVDELRPALRPPFVFFGHSMGALLSFEVARELRRRGLWSPALIAVSAFRAPHLPRRHADWHTLPEVELLAQVARLGAVSQEVLEEPQLRAILLPVLRSDFELCERYRHVSEAPLAAPILACGSRSDVLVSYDELVAWETCTSQAFRLHLVDGDHFAVLRGPKDLLRVLKDTLTFAGLLGAGRALQTR